MTHSVLVHIRGELRTVKPDWSYCRLTSFSSFVCNEYQLCSCIPAETCHATIMNEHQKGLISNGSSTYYGSVSKMALCGGYTQMNLVFFASYGSILGIPLLLYVSPVYPPELTVTSSVTFCSWRRTISAHHHDFMNKISTEIK